VIRFVEVRSVELAFKSGLSFARACLASSDRLRSAFLTGVIFLISLIATVFLLIFEGYRGVIGFTSILASSRFWVAGWRGTVSFLVSKVSVGYR